MSKSGFLSRLPADVLRLLANYMDALDLAYFVYEFKDLRPVLLSQVRPEIYDCPCAAQLLQASKTNTTFVCRCTWCMVKYGKLDQLKAFGGYNDTRLVGVAIASGRVDMFCFLVSQTLSWQGQEEWRRACVYWIDRLRRRDFLNYVPQSWYRFM